MTVQNRVGPPVRGDDLFGRDGFVDLVWEKLASTHILLAAPRRFGKTSIMYRLIDEPRNGFKIVHADLEHLRHPSELITELTAQLAKDDLFSKALSGLSYLPKSGFAAFRKTVEEVEIHKFKVKLKEQVRPHWRESGEELFERIQKSEKRLLFILDELPMMIDAMARSDDGRDEAITMLRWFRALRVSPKCEKVRFAIAGSIGIGHVLSQLGETASINDIEQLRLEPFPPKVAADLIDRLAKSERITISAGCRKQMLALIGTHVPYFIQVLFSEVVKAHKIDHKKITPKRVEQIYRDKVLGIDCKTYFDHYYGRLRDYYEPVEERVVKNMLRELALADSLQRSYCFQVYKNGLRKDASADGFSHLMANLENDFYISFDSETKSYSFACKILRDWWLRHYGFEATE